MTKIELIKEISEIIRDFNNTGIEFVIEVLDIRSGVVVSFGNGTVTEREKLRSNIALVLSGLMGPFEYDIRGKKAVA